MAAKPKTINGLMKYLRDEKGMSISGSAQKRKLKNIGYYHGYKGYRYINKPGNQVSYATFDQLVSVYDFDTQVKTLLYPHVMYIETAIKNHVLDVVVSEVNSDNFIVIYNTLLDDYKRFSTAGKTYPNTKARKAAEEKFKRALKRRLELRNRIYRVQTEAFSNDNRIAKHYVGKDQALPIWSTFELLSLGEFGYFVSCLNQATRSKVSSGLGIRPADDSSALLPQRLIYATRDLRNAIAHNDVVFDARFRTGGIDSQVGNAICNVSGLSALTFDTITDWIALIIYQLKLLQVPKTDMRRLISGFEEAVNKLHSNIPTSIFNQIIHTNHNAKIAALKNYISS